MYHYIYISAVATSKWQTGMSHSWQVRTLCSRYNEDSSAQISASTDRQVLSPVTAKQFSGEQFDGSQMAEVLVLDACAFVSTQTQAPPAPVFNTGCFPWSDAMEDAAQTAAAAPGAPAPGPRVWPPRRQVLPNRSNIPAQQRLLPMPTFGRQPVAVVAGQAEVVGV